jgi:predicted Fe-Mo cluster-binding NifX family protein
MKVAVTAKTGDISSPIDPRFGRAPWIVLVDTETGASEIHDNERAAQAEHGAGIRAAQALASLGAQALITGNVGPNAFETLKAAGIKIYLTYAGTVQGTIERLKNGKLSPAESPSKKGHG